jgi:hypothetical protein
MKSPHTQRPDADAREQTEEVIAANARTAAAARAKDDVDSGAAAEAPAKS